MILKQGNNPYVLEVEEIKKVRKKAKFIFDKETKDKNVHIFDPRLHTMELSRAQDTKLSVKSYLGPMPYNEKLRRGGKERALEIAEAQLGKIEVLKGRYRNRAREYPHRLVEDRVMGKTRDNKMVPGQKNLQEEILHQHPHTGPLSRGNGCKSWWLSRFDCTQHPRGTYQQTPGGRPKGKLQDPEEVQH